MLSVKQRLKLLSLSLGIFISYTIFGVIQERLFRGQYNAEDDKSSPEIFTHAMAFVAIQMIVYSTFAKGVLIFQEDESAEPPKVHHKLFFLTSFFYVSAMVTANMALQWISYPTQVVAKSSKPIPVMFFGVLLGRKSYSAQKYFFVLLIVIGVALFIYKDKSESSEGSILGNCLIGFSLLMDGLTGAAQDRMRSNCRPSAMNFMYYVNGWGAVILIAIMSVTGEGRDLIEFAFRHPVVILHIGLAVTVGTFGQIFISSMISNFGSLPLSLVTTTRKFFTVFVSVLVFGNNLSTQQWIASGIVFTALLLDAIFIKKTKTPSQSVTNDTVESALEMEKNNKNDKSTIVLENNNVAQINLDERGK